MNTMLPMLAVALLIWAGIFFFLLTIDRKVKALERQIEEQQRQRESHEGKRV